MKLGCVIMASGEGKRFGSNKMLADIYGEPLIARTIDSVPRGFDVVVSTPVSYTHLTLPTKA